MELKLTRLSLSTCNRPVDVVLHWRENHDLLLDPPYQRGDVWGLRRKRNLWKSLIQRIPIPSLVINDRLEAGWGNGELAIVDGKQRIAAVLDYFDGKFGLPGEWFGSSDFVFYGDLPIVLKRSLRHRTFGVSEGTVKSLEAEKELFDLVNFGGVPQGESDEDMLDS